MNTANHSDFKAVDFDALFTSFCLIVIIGILELTPERGICSQPFVFWFSLKALTLILRLALKAGFPQYSTRSWFKLILALIKLFSVAWIIYGITMLALETKCTTSDTFYLGVLGFISAFMIGTVVFFIIFVVTLISLRNPSQEDEEKTDIKSRLVV